MKPRTKLQHEVLYLSESLLKREEKILSWAKDACLEHIGYATKNRVVCMDCGDKFPPSLVEESKATCPHCSASLNIEVSKKTTNKQNIIVAIAEVFNVYQVIRTFEIKSTHRAGWAAEYSIHEICQNWIGERNTIVAKKHTLNWCADSWNGKMEIRTNRRRCYSGGINKYNVYPMKYHPDSVFKNEYKKYGINHELEGLTFIDAIEELPNNPKSETLLKAKQYFLFAHAKGNHGSINRYWATIKICMRNGYIVGHCSDYFDYLDLLTYFHKDLHNAHYVCPADFKGAHDRLVVKKRLIQKSESLAAKRKKLMRDGSEFEALKKQFFGIEFKEAEIHVKVIDNIDDFIAEGDEMHHCLYASDYHLKADSLILSARVNEKRMETIEVSLKDFDVKQSRGVRNSNTEYHDRIVNLVKRNMPLIQQRAGV